MNYYFNYFPTWNRIWKKNVFVYNIIISKINSQLWFDVNEVVSPEGKTFFFVLFCFLLFKNKNRFFSSDEEIRCASLNNSNSLQVTLKLIWHILTICQRFFLICLFLFAHLSISCICNSFKSYKLLFSIVHFK